MDEIGQKLTDVIYTPVGFQKLVIASAPMGSRYVCDPPVMDTDRDTVIQVSNLQQAEAALLAEGWEPCHNGEYIEGCFKAYRKGVDNYIITESHTFFERYMLAAEGAKALNLTNKEDRIKLHEALVRASYIMFQLYQWPEDPKESIK